ncbi:branched-chain amino acid ABC transporter substrate-binding protein [Paracoccaceae bacterium]|nr:branched-chain amino acid ABC transporter substrate-binding protein [Paracoccaceae bacterium]
MTRRLGLLTIFLIWPMGVLAQLSISVGYLKVEQSRGASLSNIDPTPVDAGLAGARLGVGDNLTSGTFLGHKHKLLETRVDSRGDVQAAARVLLADVAVLIVDAPSQDLVAIADLPDAQNRIVFNVAAGGSALRDDACRANFLHSGVSDLMRSDALIQFLSSKRWGRISIIAGPRQRDTDFMQAIQRSAAKFRLQIVDDIVWDVDADMRRNAAQKVPILTQNFKAHDVTMVIDTADDFGRYIAYNTWQAKPIVGTEGLAARGWSEVIERWGEAQLQSRFEALSGRSMRADDYAAWAAMRSVGEAVTRTGSAEAATLRSYMLSDQFELAGFKGRALSYRDWNGQLRQPIPLVTDRAMVAIAPLPGFLHQQTELDTLGLDRFESRCQAFQL